MNTDALVSHDNIASFGDDKENHYHFKIWEQRKLPSRTQRKRLGLSYRHALARSAVGYPPGLGLGLELPGGPSLVICLHVVHNSSGIMSEIRNKRRFYGGIQAYVCLPKEPPVSPLLFVCKTRMSSWAPLFAKVLFVIEMKWSQLPNAMGRQEPEKDIMNYGPQGRGGRRGGRERNQSAKALETAFGVKERERAVCSM